VKAWTIAHMSWVRQLRFAQPAQEATRLDYLHGVEHMSERIRRLEESIREAVQQAPPPLLAVVQGLQAMRGIALISAVTIASEIGAVSRFPSARQLMSYSGTVPSENSSGKRTQRGRITKSGNAHLRRILGEAAWSYRRTPAIGAALRKRQEGVPEEIRQIAWKAQVRLCKRYARLQAANKDPGKIVTAVGREMLGFIWAIGLRAESSIPKLTAV
jgi:transposase